MKKVTCGRGVPLVPFSIDEDYVMKRFIEGMETKGLHPVEIVRGMYAFPEVTMIKLHEMDRTGTGGDAVLQEIFCRIVGDSMPHSCAAVQLDEAIKIGELENNPCYSFNYDMLATAVYEKQLFGFQKHNQLLPSLQDVADLVQRYQEDSLNLTHHDFATTCVEKEKMERILNAYQ